MVRSIRDWVSIFHVRKKKINKKANFYVLVNVCLSGMNLLLFFLHFAVALPKGIIIVGVRLTKLFRGSFLDDVLRCRAWSYTRNEEK